MKELVSVVVPVYNVKQYLEKCLDSIIEQTYSNIEIILVDDGSTDGSSQICDAYCLKDNRIKVMHQVNSGVVSARKVGIGVAEGKYLLNVDSDDWIETDMIESLLAVAIKNNADIVTSGYSREDAETHAIIIDSLPEKLYSSDDESMKYLCEHLIYNGSVEKVGITPLLWNKLFRTSLLRDVFLELNDEITYGEDAACVYVCCVLANRIAITHKVFYHRAMREGSAIHSFHANYLCTLNDIYFFEKRFFEKSLYSEQLMKQVSLYVAKMALFGINYLLGINREVAIPYYDFSKEIMEKGAKVILYGAGRVGQAFYKQIQSDKLYELVGWVDRDYLRYQEQGLNVQPISNICNIEFDYIILAFKYEEMARKIANTLSSEYGIEPKKMLWLEPISIVDKYCF